MDHSQKEARVEAAPPSSDVSSLNCIDLSMPDIHKSVSQLKQACLDTSFFYVINHGISQELIDEVFTQSERFFSLPLSEKMKLLLNESYRGYTPMFKEKLDPGNQVNGDYKEGYSIGLETARDDPKENRLFNGPNIWPSSDILPGWRETMIKYQLQALGVARRVAKIIAIALDLDEGYFDSSENLGEPLSTLKLLHYQGCVSEPEEGKYAAGAHTDFGMLTLLATDDVAGLQICKDKDAIPQKWEYVPPKRGAFVVNLGDLLERWSNCIFRSTLHRVLGNGQERYSVAFFVEPSHDCLVECFPTCQSPENPPKFPPVKCVTYMLQRYMDTRSI